MRTLVVWYIRYIRYIGLSRRFALIQMEDQGMFDTPIFHPCHLLQRLRVVLAKECNVKPVPTPVTVVGDVHGQAFWGGGNGRNFHMKWFLGPFLVMFRRFGSCFLWSTPMMVMIADADAVDFIFIFICIRYIHRLI